MNPLDIAIDCRIPGTARNPAHINLSPALNNHVIDGFPARFGRRIRAQSPMPALIEL